MTYSYRCPDGHMTEVQARIGENRSVEPCATCAKDSVRDYHADFSGITFGVVDPFRSFDLSCAKTRAEGEQQRHLDSPRDNFERKYLEKAHGRTYIGNDTSGFSKSAKRGIAEYQAKKLAGYVR